MESKKQFRSRFKSSSVVNGYLNQWMAIQSPRIQENITDTGLITEETSYLEWGWWQAAWMQWTFKRPWAMASLYKENNRQLVTEGSNDPLTWKRLAHLHIWLSTKINQCCAVSTTINDNCMSIKTSRIYNYIKQTIMLNMMLLTMKSTLLKYWNLREVGQNRNLWLLQCIKKKAVVLLIFPEVSLSEAWSFAAFCSQPTTI